MGERTARRHVGWKGASVIAVLAVLLPAGLAFAFTNPTPDVPEGSFNDLIVESGSDTTSLVMGQLDNLYNQAPGCEIINPALTLTDTGTPTPGPQYEDFRCRADLAGFTDTHENYFHTVVAPEPPLGSGNGQRQICRTDSTGDVTHIADVHVDYSRSSSGVPGTKLCSGLHWVAYAMEGLAWMTWPTAVKNNGALSAGVTDLTVNQLADIYTCTTTDWSQLPGHLHSGTIRVYTAQSGSGTRATWDSKLGGITEGSCVIPVTENEVGEVFANAKAGGSNMGDAIFYTSTAAFTTRHLNQKDPNNKKAVAKQGNVGGVAPTTANITGGSYVLRRYVYNVYCQGNAAACPGGATTLQGLDYMGVDVTGHAYNGWLCKGGGLAGEGGETHTPLNELPDDSGTVTVGDHGADPFNPSVNFRTEIANAITAQGFIPLAWGTTGGGASGSSYCRLDTNL